MYDKRFEPVEIIEQYTDRSRRVLRFRLFEATLVLDYDAYEKRETRRHKWRVQKSWHRIERARCTMPRQLVSAETKWRALNMIRMQIEYEKEPA